MRSSGVSGVTIGTKIPCRRERSITVEEYIDGLPCAVHDRQSTLMTADCRARLAPLVNWQQPTLQAVADQPLDRPELVEVPLTHEGHRSTRPARPGRPTDPVHVGLRVLG